MELLNDNKRKKALYAGLVEAISQQDQGELKRVVLDVRPMDLLGWLRCQTDARRAYWRSRERSLEFAALGVAWEVERLDPTEAIAALQACLADSDEGVRAVGGMAFHPTAPHKGAWEGLGKELFWVPRFEVFRNDQHWSLAVNLRRTELEDVMSAWEGLIWPEAVVSQVPSPLNIRYEPSESVWQDSVLRLREELGEGLGKLVLACQCHVTLDAPIDPYGLLARLQQQDGGGYDFVIQDGKASFLGCTPECLYRRAGLHVHTEAIAGTLAGQQGTPLDQSPKELAEHDYVVRDIAQALGTICSQIEYNEGKGLVSLGNLQHLYTEFQARLNKGKGDVDLIRALHPSAAVLGSPRAQAWQALETFEGFDRGWYAGPVGWMSRDTAEFAVGIRSALLRGVDMTLFAGAGIVDGSEPAREWQEVRDKMKPILTALGVTQA